MCSLDGSQGVAVGYKNVLEFVEGLGMQTHGRVSKIFINLILQKLVHVAVGIFLQFELILIFLKIFQKN